MSKRERHRIIKSVWAYLSKNSTIAFDAKDEADFDWYANGLECFFRCLGDQPFHITPRVKPL